MPIPHPRTILMVDDDRQHLQMQSLIMNQAGLRVVIVVVGRDTLGLPENEHPGLIFMDYRLNSTLTSPQVAVLLRQTFALVPIVLLSNEVTMPPEMTTLVDAFIRKSDPEQLVQFARNFFESGIIAAEQPPSSL